MHPNNLVHCTIRLSGNVFSWNSKPCQINAQEYFMRPIWLLLWYHVGLLAVQLQSVGLYVIESMTDIPRSKSHEANLLI